MLNLQTNQLVQRSENISLIYKDSIDFVKSTDSKEIIVLNEMLDSRSIAESTNFDSSESLRDISSSDESDKNNELENFNKFIKTKKTLNNIYKKKKSNEVEVNETRNYIGGTTSEFNKFSPFINMLINRRIRFSELGPSCHIAAFVPDFGIENKYASWAFGKIAIGENSERNRFGNAQLSTHAEMDALRKLDNLIRVKKCKKQKMDLVVIRVNKVGNLCESAPCYHCTQELSKSQMVTINKLYFSRNNRTITCIKFSDWLTNKNLHISKGWRWLSCCK
jgi:hypothetical protein